MRVNSLKYNEVIERDDDGLYIANIPELPGCHTQARTIDEVMKRIKEAAELYIETTGVKSSESEFVGIQILEVSISEP